ncbi:MAG TPA: glycoside hydrolase family 38 C-terminal domain-containing protein, partial [Acidisarcina sp.]
MSLSLSNKISRTAASALFLTAAILVSLSCGLFSMAQSPQPVAHSLTAASQKVLDRLSRFNMLPADEWRYHAGDVAHGEAVDLDDSGWSVVKPHSSSPTDAVWYRRQVEVPKTLNGYDLSGARIWFRFEANANGPMPEIIYFNGRRVALGDDLEPIILFDRAKAGDKVLIAVKLLHTIDKKSFNGTSLKIEFSPDRPNPEDLRVQLISAARLIPSLSQEATQDWATLEKAVETVDFEALDAGNQQRFDTSLIAARKGLEPLVPVLQRATFHVTGNSHIDAAWLWPWTETVDVVRRTFGTALQLMNEYPDYTYTQSAAQYNEWIAEKYPQMNEEIKRRIKEGRWEIVGGMWVEPDLNMPDGESQVRSLLLGKRWFMKQYGVDVRIGWNPDSFGYNWQLPQIYKRSGIDYFVTQKMTWNDTNQLPFKLFWWESPDGSKVLTYFPHDYGNNDLSPVRLSEDLATARRKSPGMLQMMDLYGIGDHGGGPTRAVLDEGQHWADPARAVPKMQFGLAQSFFTNTERQLAPSSPEWNYQSIARGYKYPDPVESKVAIPTWKDEMYFEYHRGVMTTQANHKRNMRESEEWALNSEKYASLAWLDGVPYPAQELNDAWKKITFNNFHDLAAGSGIGVIYREAQQDYDRVRWATNEISSRALGTLAARVDTSTPAIGEVPVFVFNPLAWARSGVVEVSVQMPGVSPHPGAATMATRAPALPVITVSDARGRALPSMVVSRDAATRSYLLRIVVQDVPSMGYKVLHVSDHNTQISSPIVSDIKASGTTIENAALRVVVDPASGCITSLYDKKSKFEAIAKDGCGNQLQTFKDTPKDYDAWNIDPGTLDRVTTIDKADKVELVENGPMRAVIRVTRTWQHSKFVQEIMLYSGMHTVDIVNDIDWHETHVLLKAAFPLAASGPMATYEIPYGTIDRPTTRNNSWESAKFEVPALRWADLGDGQHGVSLINESKYGYDAKDNVLRLSLLRSPTWPDPDADRGHHHFSYALYPHAGSWKEALTERAGYEFNYKLAAMQVMAHEGEMPSEHSFVSVAQDNVAMTAVKKAEDNDGLI